MNFSTMLGFILSTTVFGTALFLSAKDFRIFLDTNAMLLVVGGTMAASTICFPLPKMFNLVKVFFRRIIGRSKHNYAALIEEIITLAQAARRGRPAFEATIGKIDDFFLKDSAQVLFWLDAEVSHEDLRELLETRAETHYERYIEESDIFRVMSKFPPAFGLLGTTLGMIALLQSLGGTQARTVIGPAMSVALVATLYGIILANFIFVPIAFVLLSLFPISICSCSWRCASQHCLSFWINILIFIF